MIMHTFADWGNTGHNMAESLDFVGFSREKQIIYTLFIPLEDRIGIIKKVVIIQLVKK